MVLQQAGRIILIICVIISVFSMPAFGWGGPDNVLVVQNGNSPTSMDIASYYMQKRGIPAQNLCTITTIDSALSYANQFISESDYGTQIEQPIVNYLSSQGLTYQIQYIVLTKGIPHRQSTGPPTGGKSTDSELSSYDITPERKLYFSVGDPTDWAYINNYWREDDTYTHSAFGGYLVTRLDGLTVNDAKQLVDNAMSADILPHRVLLDTDPSKGYGNIADQPKWFLLPNGQFDSNYHLYYSDYNADMQLAAQIISSLPYLSVTLDETSTFQGSTDPLAMYCSWGSNDSNYDEPTYQTMPFARQSIAETAVSTSARTFLGATTGQSLITDLIAQGVSGVKGYASEPYLDAIASPSVLYDLYSSGRNLAESFYAASRLRSWKDVVIGDPLMCMDVKCGNAKKLADGDQVVFGHKLVTAGNDEFDGYFYVVDDDRSAGIQVRQAAGGITVTRGMRVCLRGTMATINGERVVDQAEIIYSY